MTDRKASNPGQYKAVIPATEQEAMRAGDHFTMTLVRDDNPITEGTPYNKESVLPDELAEEICPDIVDPTPADALRALNGKVKAICELLMPVGYIFEWAQVEGGLDLSTAEKVAAYYGFGVWESYGSGRMTLGVASEHKAGQTGGEAMHKLTTQEMPGHTHQERIAVYGYRDWKEKKIYDYSAAIDYQTPNYHGKNTTLNIAEVPANASTYITGEGKAHNNMPPYVVVYRWRRVR